MAAPHRSPPARPAPAFALEFAPPWAVAAQLGQTWVNTAFALGEAMAEAAAAQARAAFELATLPLAGLRTLADWPDVTDPWRTSLMFAEEQAEQFAMAAEQTMADLERVESQPAALPE